MGIITISREFGSGGRELGKKLAEKLGYKYYDKSIISQVSKEGNINENYIENAINKINDFSYTQRSSFNFYSTHQKYVTDILIMERKVIQELAKKGNCVIVGRGADVILKNEDTFDIFVYANMQSKIKRCKDNALKEEVLQDKELDKKIKTIDKARQKFYLMLGQDNWGQKENYDLCVNTTNADLNKLATGLAGLIKGYLGEK